MFYSALIRPLLFQFDPEAVHHAAFRVLSNPILASLSAIGAGVHSKGMEREVFGLKFPHPIGLAAGFDKNALALPAWEKLGFGFAELGTVTQHAQPGNPRPRIFRIPESQAVINRMGFPNDGSEAIADRLEKLRQSGAWPRIPIGINLGKSKTTPLEEAPQDYLASFRKLRDFADYVAINVSSPNTPGLRSLQTREALLSILQPLMQENRIGKRVPILVKIAPDLSLEEIDSVLEVLQEVGANGLIATNTTIDKSSVALKEEGGLSGKPVRAKSTEIIRHVAKRTEGKLPIIGAGGIFNAADAQEKLEAGATLLQVYTGFIYEGPWMMRKIVEGLRSK